MDQSYVMLYSSYPMPATDVLLPKNSKTHMEKDKDLLNKKQKEYCKKYPKRRKATTKKYRENNKEKLVDDNRKYVKEHPDWYNEQKIICVEKARNRRSLYYHCNSCGVSIEVKDGVCDKCVLRRKKMTMFRHTDGYCKYCGKELGYTFTRLGLCQACAFRRDTKKYKSRVRRCYKNRSIELKIKDSIRGMRYYYRYKWYLNSKPSKTLGMSNLCEKRLKDFNAEHEAIEKEIKHLGLRAPSRIWTAGRIVKLFEKWKDYQHVCDNIGVMEES